MTLLILELLIMLLAILVAAELFTNALEHLGHRLNISEGVTGSLFAAVGTALPETLVPLLAIFVGSKNTQLNQEIGVGAILGAPLMLSTLSTALMAFAVIRQRGARGRVQPEYTGFSRDLNFFLFAFFLAALAMLLPQNPVWPRWTFSGVLVLTYVAYVTMTLRASEALVDAGHSTEAEAQMLLSRLGLPVNLPVIGLQLLIALALLVVGARGFIHGVEGISQLLGLSPLLLSLLIIPIATELPEKINSILWVRRRKDTMAFGNITGAMVFQGTLLPALGITLTPWQPRVEVFTGIVITLLAAIWLRVLASRKGLPIWALLINGVLYVSYLVITLAR